jgi:hypothetical protein
MFSLEVDDFNFRIKNFPFICSNSPAAPAFTTSGTYPWSFVTQIFHNGQPSHGGDGNIFKVMISTLPRGTLGSVATLLAEFYVYVL